MFWEICRLRLAPQDVPTSSSLLVSSFIAYATFSLAQGVIELSVARAMVAAMVDTLLLGTLSYFLLWARMHANRWMQTATALAGSGAIFEAMSLPFLVWQHQLDKQDPMALVPFLFTLALLFWFIVVIGHILRHALSTGLAVGAVLATLYMYLSLSVMSIIFFGVEPA